jgi:cobalt/nickel transport system ATP-binding protein
MDNKDIIIELKNVSFGYGTSGNPFLRNLNFSFKRGEKAALTGANGSGKTSFFHIIMGLLKPFNGKIKIFGEERNRPSDYLEVRRRIGLLFQDSDDQLFSPTVEEDIAFGPLNLGKSRSEVRRIISETLNLLGLNGFEERVTYKLSGGEKRLVALGTVLAMEPEVLLLDEPVTGLDDEHTEKFMNVLNSINSSYIVISHDHDFLKCTTRISYTFKNETIIPASQG